MVEIVKVSGAVKGKFVWCRFLAKWGYVPDEMGKVSGAVKGSFG